MVTGIHHISLKCASKEELEKVKDFYMGILGFTLKREWETGIMLDSGSGLLEIFSNGEGVPDIGAIRHMAFSTDDADEIVQKVKEAGYTVFMGPADIVIASDPPYPDRVAFCYGPLHEEIEFFQER